MECFLELLFLINNTGTPILKRVMYISNLGLNRVHNNFSFVIFLWGCYSAAGSIGDVFLPYVSSLFSLHTLLLQNLMVWEAAAAAHLFAWKNDLRLFFRCCMYRMNSFFINKLEAKTHGLRSRAFLLADKWSLGT